MWRQQSSVARLPVLLQQRALALLRGFAACLRQVCGTALQPAPTAASSVSVGASWQHRVVRAPTPTHLRPTISKCLRWLMRSNADSTGFGGVAASEAVRRSAALLAFAMVAAAACARRRRRGGAARAATPSRGAESTTAHARERRLCFWLPGPYLPSFVVRYTKLRFSPSCRTAVTDAPARAEHALARRGLGHGGGGRRRRRGA